MVGAQVSKVDPVDGIELIHWFDWRGRPWGPLMAAERQFDASSPKAETPRGRPRTTTFLTWPIGRSGGSSTMRARI